MKMPFQESGRGEPLILLHAFPLSHRMWNPNRNFLNELGFRLITPDLRGFGENTSFSDINLLEDMANDVAELMDSLEIQKALIGGLSMGGYVTFNLYRLFPERFSAVILCDTNSAADSVDKKQTRFDLIEKIEKKGTEALIEDVLPNLVSQHTKNNNPELVRHLETEFRNCSADGAVAALRGMAERDDHTGILKKIDVPALLIFGEHDSVTNLEVAESMRELIPDARLEIIENAGHYSNLENVEAFNAAMAKFASKLGI